jgi:hypothetical protein
MLAVRCAGRFIALLLVLVSLNTFAAECIPNVPLQIVNDVLGGTYNLRGEALIRVVNEASTWRTQCSVPLALPPPTPSPYDCTHEGVIGASLMKISGAPLSLSLSTSDTDPPFFQTTLSDVKLDDVTLTNGHSLVKKGDKLFTPQYGPYKGNSYAVYVYLRHNRKVAGNAPENDKVYKTYRLELFNIIDTQCLKKEPERAGNLTIYPEDKSALLRMDGKSDYINETQVGDGSEPRRQ